MTFELSKSSELEMKLSINDADHDLMVVEIASQTLEMSRKHKVSA